MLNRLKAAWRILFSKHYILTTFEVPWMPRTRYSCDLHNLHAVSWQLSIDAKHAQQMNSLLLQANEVLKQPTNKQ